MLSACCGHSNNKIKQSCVISLAQYSLRYKSAFIAAWLGACFGWYRTMARSPAGKKNFYSPVTFAVQCEIML